MAEPVFETWVCLALESAVLTRWVHQTPQLGQLGSHRSDLRQCEYCEREKVLANRCCHRSLAHFAIYFAGKFNEHPPHASPCVGTGRQAPVGSGGPIPSLRDCIHEDKKGVFLTQGAKAAGGQTGLQLVQVGMCGWEGRRWWVTRISKPLQEVFPRKANRAGVWKGEG